MSDTYHNFNDLISKERADTDFTIEVKDRGTDTVIVGIHGGQIEPGTEEVVRAIAGEDLSYYLFLGTGSHQHITSSHFDDEALLSLLAKSKTVLSIHGKKGNEEFIMLGGLDTDLLHLATEYLTTAGYNLLPPEEGVAGLQANNICNRGTSGRGLQIELSKGLREAFSKNQRRLENFAQVIRKLTQ